MKRESLLPLSLFTLAAAIAIHAAWPDTARAQLAPEPICTSFDVSIAGDLVEEGAEIWMDEMLATGRVNFVYIGSYLPTVCAW